MEKFVWFPTESAPEAYPVEIVRGHLIFPDGSAVYVPDHQVAHNGWGETGSTHIVGDEAKPIPEWLDITWFSYTENVFYAGRFDLRPTRVRDLFLAGLDSPLSGKHITYDRVIVGLAPEGEVSVWLASQGVVVEAATFKAVPADVAWSAILNNDSVSRADYIADVLDEVLTDAQRARLKNYGVPKGLYRLYRMQYTWKPEVTGPVAADVLWIKTFNGERERIDTSGRAALRTHRAVPRRLDVEWTTDAGQHLLARMELDETETLAAFQKMSEGDVNRPMRFQIEIGDRSPVVNLYIRQGKYVLKLEKAQVRLYRK